MNKEGINEEDGTVNVYALLPKPGDSIMIVNCGDHFEIRQHSWNTGLALTDQDVDDLRNNRIIWN